jgi:hypothetical protein
VVFYAVIDLFRFVKKIWTGRRAQSKS